MRTALAVTALSVAVGFGAGWIARGGPREVVRTVYRDLPPSASKPVVSLEPFPDYPKPTLGTPVAEAAPSAAQGPSPTPMTGTLPQLPSPEGPIGPLTPESPSTLPVADLKADESLARRTVLAAGGDIVSVADAKDASGNVGRALVAETDPTRLDRLRSALRRALGDRVVLSDGGTAGGGSAETRKAEDALAALRKRRDAARIDYLPQAPALIELEEAVLRAEREFATLRQSTARQRLNILLRPTLAP